MNDTPILLREFYYIMVNTASATTSASLGQLSGDAGPWMLIHAPGIYNFRVMTSDYTVGE